MQQKQNIINMQIQQPTSQNINFQQNQQFIQPNLLAAAVDPTIFAQQQQVAQAQHQVAQAQQQLNMQKQMLAQQQLVLQQQLLTQQQIQLPGQTLSPQHIRNLQQQQFLAQQELQLQTQQNIIDQQNLALLAQKQQLMGQQQQKVEEILRAQRPMYTRQGSEQSQMSAADVHDPQQTVVPDPYQQKPHIQPQMSMDQIQFQNQQYVEKHLQKQPSEEHPYHPPVHSMQGQSLPQNMMVQNFGSIQQNERQISSHEGTPVQNYTANPLQMYQHHPGQSMQNVAYRPVETSAPSTVPTTLPQNPPVTQYQQVENSAASISTSVPASIPTSIPPTTSTPTSAPTSIAAQLPADVKPPSQVQDTVPKQLSIQTDEGSVPNGHKEQFHTPMTEFPSGATHIEAIRQPELSSVEEKQAENQQQDGKYNKIVKIIF